MSRQKSTLKTVPTQAPAAPPAPQAALAQDLPPIRLHLHWLRTKFTLLEYAFAGFMDTLEGESGSPFFALFEDMGHDLCSLEEDVQAIMAAREVSLVKGGAA